MDTLTHALVATAVSDGWFRGRLGKVATPFALIMGALPDVDTLTYLVSAQTAWMHHRGYTHSFALLLLAAPLLGYAGLRMAKREGAWWMWTLLALLGLYLHTIFDLVTSFGTMPLLPFSNARISWDVAPVLDVFVFTVAGASFVLNRFLRREKVRRELNPLVAPVVYKHPKRTRSAGWVGKIAMVLITVYLVVGWQQNRSVVQTAREQLLAQGVAAVEIRAMPVMLTFIAWNIAARDTAGNVYNAAYSSYAKGAMQFKRYATLPEAETKAVLSTQPGKMFAWYSQGMFIADRPQGDTTCVRLQDRRFLRLQQPELPVFTIEFADTAANGRVVTKTEQRSVSGMDITEEFRCLWNLTWYGATASALGEVSTNARE